MRHDPSRMNIVRRDEKEAKLREFVERHLNARRALCALDPEAAAVSDTCYIVSRSSESPVAKVLHGLLSEIASQGIAIKALYAMPTGDQPFLGQPSPWTPTRIECRRAGDMRLLEAHELLILGPHTAWVGDCMRREPSQSDAYEFYTDECHDMASAALRSFSRLWAIAKPYRLRLVSETTMPLAAAAAQAMVDVAMPVSFSRH